MSPRPAWCEHGNRRALCPTCHPHVQPAPALALEAGIPEIPWPFAAREHANARSREESMNMVTVPDVRPRYRRKTSTNVGPKRPRTRTRLRWNIAELCAVAAVMGWSVALVLAIGYLI